MKTKRCIGPKPKVCSVNLNYIKDSNFYEPSNIDPFLLEERTPVVGSTPSVRLVSDVYMLFNQQRLDRMTREALIQRFDEMSVTSNSLNQIRQKMSDDQLISFIKSRYIQTPSELQAYYNYLSTEIGEVASQVAEKNAKAQAEYEAKLKQSVVQSQQPQQAVTPAPV